MGMAEAWSVAIARARVRVASSAPLCGGMVLLAILAGCGGGGAADTPAPVAPAQPASADTQLRTLAKSSLGMVGDPASRRAARQVVPSTDPMVKLGQLLFFSQTLAGGYDVSCGTCHHTDFGGSDGLSISVGVVPRNSALVGPGRQIDPARDRDPSADGGPNMHRNSITTFNAALFDRSLMFDGRVFVLDSAVLAGGHGQAIRTPESGLSRDLNPLTGLMEFTMKGPIVNDNEMRGFLYTNYASPQEYRDHLVRRLRGEVDNQYNPRPGASANWLARFRTAFGNLTAPPEQVITSLNMQRALAAYIRSQIFVDTAWRRFLEGDSAAISESAKAGARLFLAPRTEGGLGCVGCHRGDRFTDESFHNVGFPQIGRGFGRSDRTDRGRWLATRNESDVMTFRTPSILNVARTAPYGHAGSFGTLADLLAYHANPRAASTTYDYSLSQLEQFRGGEVTYPDARRYTAEAIAQASFARAEALLPGRALTGQEAAQLQAFLEALTDACVATPACIAQWAPTSAEDPDGHTLVRNQSSGTPGAVDAEDATAYPDRIAIAFPSLAPRATFADVVACTNRIGSGDNSGQPAFVRRADPSFGLGDTHGYAATTWFGPQQTALEITMIGGGVTATYLDDDCWPDLVYTGGDISGMRYYINQSGNGFEYRDLFDGQTEREYTGTAVADLDGDYRRELLFGNLKPGAIPVFGASGTGRYQKLAELPMIRPTYGISFAPLDATGDLHFYLAHWSAATGTEGGSPALWRYSAGNAYPWDHAARTTSAHVDQRFNFTPKFADFTGDGRIDLALASDFLTGATLRNVQAGSNGWYFANDTDRAVITDENGMGSTLLDIDNDGVLEWFVTAVADPTGQPAANWGATGNRLYRNASTADRIAFTDITDRAGVRNGYWGWGACAADFNNDGFIDIFHVNGFGAVPSTVVRTDDALDLQTRANQLTATLFQNKPPRLFINNGDGTFTDRATAWSIDAPSEGRGLACLDHDRDGDVDIVLFDHSRGLQFFENRVGSGAGHRFLGVRLVGAPPNTDAIGAKVQVTANVGSGRGVQTQLRLAEANSNFNSQNLPDLYFGLGEAEAVTSIRVTWPGGAELTCSNVPANRFVVLDQRAGQAACPAPGP